MSQVADKKEAGILLIVVTMTPWWVWGMVLVVTGKLPPALTLVAFFVTVVAYGFAFMARSAHQHIESQKFAHEIMRSSGEWHADARATAMTALGAAERALVRLRGVLDPLAMGVDLNSRVDRSGLASEMDSISEILAFARTTLNAFEGVKGQSPSKSLGVRPLV